MIEASEDIPTYNDIENEVLPTYIQSEGVETPTLFTNIARYSAATIGLAGTGVLGFGIASQDLTSSLIGGFSMVLGSLIFYSTCKNPDTIIRLPRAEQYRQIQLAGDL